MSGFDKFLKNLGADEKEKLFMQLLESQSLSELQAARENRTNINPIKDFTKAAKERYKQWGKMQGLSSGFLHVDEMTMGFVGGELIVLSGHTSHGKTQLAMNIAYKVASHDKPVLFVTMEMTKVELTARFMKVAEPDPIKDLPIHFQEAPNLNYQDINLLIRKAKEKDVKLVILDHLHYFVRSVEYASSEIGRIVKELKEAAVVNDIPIILISHVRKLGITKRPTIEDLRDSSFIGQDADIVLMVYRDLRPDSKDTQEMETLILKNRNRGLFVNNRRRYFTSQDGARLTEVSKKEHDEANKKEDEDDIVIDELFDDEGPSDGKTRAAGKD